MKRSKISLAWIDTQGHEGHVLAGAGKFLAVPIPFVAEFWPYGLERSGGWKLLRDIFEAKKFLVFDLRQSIEQKSLVQLSFYDLDSMYEKWVREENLAASPHTDLLVLHEAMK